jgi:hypothetical protein
MDPRAMPTGKGPMRGQDVQISDLCRDGAVYEGIINIIIIIIIIIMELAGHYKQITEYWRT